MDQTLTNCKLIASLLDFRALLANHLSKQALETARSCLKDAYIALGKQAHYWLEERSTAVVIEDVTAGSKRKATSTITAEQQRKHLDPSDLESALFYCDDPFADMSQDAETDTEASAAVAEAHLNEKLDAEFEQCFKVWCELKINFHQFFPHLPVESEDMWLDVISDLMDVDMGVAYNDVMEKDSNHLTYGWLPLMASCSVGHGGEFL